MGSFTGVFYAHSQVRITDITKGTSNQVMIGEKYLNRIEFLPW